MSINVGRIDDILSIKRPPVLVCFCLKIHLQWLIHCGYHLTSIGCAKHYPRPSWQLVIEGEFVGQDAIFEDLDLILYGQYMVDFL